MHDEHSKTGDPAVGSTRSLGAVVEVNMIGYDGRWLVVKDCGAKVWVQRPQDFKPKWVLRRYIKAPNESGDRQISLLTAVPLGWQLPWAPDAG
jgi:hypothetical protein